MRWQDGYPCDLGSMTQERCKFLFDYHNDGFLTWKNPNKYNKYLIGQKLWMHKQSETRRVRIKGITYSEPNLIYLFHKGKYPMFVQHEDRNNKNNKIENLKPVNSSNQRHNKSNTLEYNCWIAMKSRCFNKKNADYILYGGRGITVCERWKHSFENFYLDMGKRPSIQYSIHRIDNDGIYEPSNCKWVFQKIQCQNQNRSKGTVPYQGVTLALNKGHWFGRYQVSYSGKYLGFSESAVHCAMIYDKYVLKEIDIDARLNFPHMKNEYLKEIENARL